MLLLGAFGAMMAAMMVARNAAAQNLGLYDFSSTDQYSNNFTGTYQGQQVSCSDFLRAVESYNTSNIRFDGGTTSFTANNTFLTNPVSYDFRCSGISGTGPYFGTFVRVQPNNMGILLVAEVVNSTTLEITFRDGAYINNTAKNSPFWDASFNLSSHTITDKTGTGGTIGSSVSSLAVGNWYHCAVTQSYNGTNSIYSLTVSTQNGTLIASSGNIAYTAGTNYDAAGKVGLSLSTPDSGTYNLDVDNFSFIPVTATLNATMLPASRSNMCLYRPDEIITNQFTATGVANGWNLQLIIRDADDNVVSSNAYPITTSNGSWTGNIVMPGTRLGFYRVYAELLNGSNVQATLAPMSARPSSFITYCVVPDPRQRVVYRDTQSHFGMQGGFNGNVSSDVLAFLGVRWTNNGGWDWAALSPSYSSPFNAASSAKPGMVGSGWTDGNGHQWWMYDIPNLTVNGRPYGGNPDVYIAGTFAYNTGALQTQYYGDWSNFCYQVATAFPTVQTNQSQPVYEVTWEPEPTWGYGGTWPELVTLYQLAYGGIKARSTNAWVMGPCLFIDDESEISNNIALFNQNPGLLNYIDAFSCHAYMQFDNGYGPNMDPENAGQPGLISEMKQRIYQHAGRYLPMYGTEQGYAMYDLHSEVLNQARRLIRSNLLTIGEGWNVNLGFYFADYWSSPYWEYGFFYNCSTNDYSGYGPGKVNPKPIVAAYAAMTFLLDGHKSDGPVNWLGDFVRGYAFEDYATGNDVILALWDFSATGSTVTINTGEPTVIVYDWMGNATTNTTANGQLTLNLTKEPTYVRGVAPSLWGSQAPNLNVAQSKSVTVSSTDPVHYSEQTGAMAVDGDTESTFSRWVSTNNSSVAKWIIVNLGQQYTIDTVRFWTGQYITGANTNYYRNPLSSYQIQYWNSATSNWVTQVSRTGNTKSVVVETFSPPITTSQVQLYVPAGASPAQVQLYELQVLRTLTTQAGFTASPTNGPAPLPVTFSDTSVGTISNRFWDFGDGTTTNVTNTTVTHTYGVGTYSVTLIASGSSGTSTDVQPAYITALPAEATFTGQPRSGTAPLQVSFTDNSIGAITNRFWDFGDGTTTNITTTTVTHTYDTGTYSVTLIVSGSTGISTDAQPAYIAAVAPSSTITVSAGNLYGGTTNNLASSNSVAVLVVDIGTNGFSTPQPSFPLSLGATWGTENMVIGLWNLSADAAQYGNGTLLDSAVVTYTNGIAPGQQLMLYWFPSLTLASNILGVTSYGQYTDTNSPPLDNSAPWQIPAAETSVTLNFLTAFWDGSNPETAGLATLSTASAQTPLQNWQTQYFNCTGCPQADPNADPYGKGMSNTNQFQAGFNPTNSAAYLHIISIAPVNNNTDIQVTYLGANGDTTYTGGPAIRTNILEYTTGAIDGSYSNGFVSTGQTNILSGGTGLGVVTNMVDNGGATNGLSRYYRVRVLLP